MNDHESSFDDFKDFIQRLELPEATCDQVHPVVEDFMEMIDPANPDWTGDFSDWMEQANSCLTNEILDTLGEPPEAPEDRDSYLWAIVRLSWLFYRKYNDGMPFNS